MAELLEEVAGLLTGISNVYYGNLPKSPDDVVCLRHYGGANQSLSGTMISEPSFQVFVRSTVYATGNTLCVTINELLHGHTTTNIPMIQRQGYIHDLGRDENNRNEFSMNYRCYYRE